MNKPFVSTDSLSKQTVLSDSLWIVALGVLCFVPFLGSVHLFDWDEINFAESAREMLITGNYTTVQIDFQPFWEKPPLFFWMQVLAMKVFGVSEFAARFPNAVIGIITLLTLYIIGNQLHGRRFGWLWVLAYVGSFTPHFYFKTALIDPTFNYFIFLGIWFSYRAANEPQKPLRYSAWAGACIGLALLTKGPVGGLLWGLTALVIWAQYRFRAVWTVKQVVVFVGCTLGVAATWFGLEFYHHGFWFFEKFIEYQIRLFATPDSGHGQPFYYHFVVVLIGCFPSSIFAIRGMGLRVYRSENISFGEVMRTLFWVVMILFSIVTTKIVHYSSMAWYPVTYFAALSILAFIEKRAFWNRWLTVGLGVIGTLLGLVLMAVPLIGMNAAVIQPYIQDAFVVGNLQANVTWLGWEWVWGGCYLLIVWWTIGQLSRGRAQNGVVTLLLSTAVCLLLVGRMVVPKIEAYVQGAAIRFYQAHAGEAVYIETLGFKSYAHLFYFDKQPCSNPQCSNTEWLLKGAVDKPTYFVTKITDAEGYRQQPTIEVLKEENGFVFFKRKNTK
ncbi:MAG: glycosyltransferase family 39 protein [Spirosomataceae bacterium]